MGRLSIRPNRKPHPHANACTFSGSIAKRMADAAYDRAYSINEMKKLLASLTFLFFALPAFAQFDFPNAPTANQIITGPAGQALKWDGTKWVAQFGPAGGPFLPLAGGTLSAPGNLTVSGTSTLVGTVTFPSGSTATTAGFNNVVAIGIGEATQANYLLAATSSANAGATILVSNPTTGTQASAGIQINTGTGGSIYPTYISGVGAGNTSNAAFPANSFMIATSEPNGINIGTNNSPNVVNFSIAGVNVGYFNQNGLNFTQTNTPSISWGNPTQPTATVMGYGTADLYLAAGGHYNGINWIADTTGAEAIVLNPATGFDFYYNTGLTVGGTFTPFKVGNIGQLSTWTPSFQFGSTVDPAFQVYYAYYVKTGHLVFATFGMGNVNGGNLTTSGSAQICGLPYPAVSQTNQGMMSLAVFGGVQNMVGPLAGMMTGTAPGTCLQLMSIPYSGNSGAVATTSANFYGSNIQGDFWYLSAN